MKKKIEYELDVDPEIMKSTAAKHDRVLDIMLMIDDLPLGDRTALVVYLCEQWTQDGILFGYLLRSQKAMLKLRVYDD